MNQYTIPFDYCDKCLDKFPMDDIEVVEDRETGRDVYLCRECADARPDSWRKARVSKDDYDRRTKDEEDRR